MSDEILTPDSIDESDLGIKILLKKDYAVVCESLERMGVKDFKNKKLWPSCYCHKFEENGQEVYSICHFKELFLLQGKPSTFNKIDKLRRATITYLLQKWGLVEVVDAEDVSKILQQPIGVVKHNEKRDYQIVHKFKQSRT